MWEGAGTSLRSSAPPALGRVRTPVCPQFSLTAQTSGSQVTPAPPRWGLTCPCTSTRLGFCKRRGQECSCCTLVVRRARSPLPTGCWGAGRLGGGGACGALLVQVGESFLSAPASAPLPAQGARAAVCCRNYRVQSGALAARPLVGFSDSLSLSSNYPRILEEGSLPSLPLPA